MRKKSFFTRMGCIFMGITLGTMSTGCLNSDNEDKNSKLALKKWIEDSKKTFYDSVLEGLTINALGDSYFKGNGLDMDYVWLSLMANKYGMDMNNYGINGSVVAYGKGTNPMVLRYNDMPANNAQIIFVEGGRNDFNEKTPIGDVNSRDIVTYSGALNVILDGVKEKYPNAMIICFTPWNFPDKEGYDLTYKDYCDAMEAVAKAHGVCCIHADDPAVSGIDMRDPGFREKYCMNPGDVSHLNSEGMKIAMTHFERIVATYYRDFLSKK